jgi:hypothetical protein
VLNMQIRRPKYAGLLLLAALSGAVAGYWWGRQDSPASDPHQSSLTAKIGASGNKTGSPNISGAAVASASNDASPSVLFPAALRERVGHLRWARTMEAVGKMNEGNWRETLAAFDSVTATTGAEFWNERVIVLTRVGDLGGQTAVEELLAKDRAAGKGFGTTSQAFEGWASRNPKAAWAWMREATDDSLRRACLPRFAWGISAADTGKQFEYFKELSEAEKAAVATDTTRALIQTGGFAPAEQLLAGEMAAAGTESGANRSLSTIFDVLARQHRHAVENGAAPEEACRWLAHYADKPFVSSEQFKQTAALLANARGANEAVSWMASIYSEASAKTTAPALGTTMQVWAGKNPNEAGQWLQSQSRHPAYATMVRGFVAAIQNVDPEAAAAWQKTIP